VFKQEFKNPSIYRCRKACVLRFDETRRQHSPIDALSEANVGDAGSIIAEQVDVWVENTRVDRLVVPHHCCRHNTTRHVTAAFAFAFFSQCL